MGTDFQLEKDDVESRNPQQSIETSPAVEYKLEVLEDFENPFLFQNSLIDGTGHQGSFRCEETSCGKMFQNSRSLENHTKRIHIGDKTVKCPECPKMFFSQGEVESHKTYLHSSSKNFNCTMCEKTFVKMADANQHMKAVHLKIKEHECRFCGKKFTQSSNMHSHMRRNHFEDWAKWKTSQMTTTPIST